MMPKFVLISQGFSVIFKTPVQREFQSKPTRSDKHIMQKHTPLYSKLLSAQKNEQKGVQKIKKTNLLTVLGLSIGQDDDPVHQNEQSIPHCHQHLSPEKNFIVQKLLCGCWKKPTKQVTGHDDFLFI